MKSTKQPKAPNLPTFRFRDQADTRREVLRTAGETLGAVLVVDLAPLCRLARKVGAAANEVFDLGFAGSAQAAAASVPDAGSPAGSGHGWNSYADSIGRPSFERLTVARFDDTRRAARAGVPAEQLDLYEHTNVWPDGPLRDLVEQFRVASAIVCEDLLREAAQAVGYPANAFVADGVDHTELALTRFFPRDEPTPGEEDGFGYAPRRDSTFVSLLSEAGEGGCFQVHDVAEDAWITAAPAPGSLVFVFGTLLERRTGGLLRAGRHRVLPPVKGARTTAAAFYNAGLGTSVLPDDRTDPAGGKASARNGSGAAGSPATVGDVYRGLVNRSLSAR